MNNSINKCKYLLAFACLFLFQKYSFSINCHEMDYPTIWHFENLISDDLNLECRVYSGGWSYQEARTLYLTIPANQNLNYSFPDHNDGLGMLDRNWSCAYHKKLKSPLMHKESNAFATEGCHHSKIAIKESIIQNEHTFLNSIKLSNNSKISCPSADKISKLNECNSSSCQWDSYGAGLWKGQAQVLNASDLSTFAFVGADTNLSKDSILGCIYYSDKLNAPLILLSHLDPQGDNYPEFRYRPEDEKKFDKFSGNIYQCFSSKPEDCSIIEK